MPVNASDGSSSKLGGNAKAAKDILSTLAKKSTILVAWEHVNIQYLAKALGVDEEQIPHWSSEDYDTVYELRYSAPDVKSLTDFRVAKENLTAGGGPAPAPTPPAPTPAGMKWWGLQVVVGFD